MIDRPIIKFIDTLADVCLCRGVSVLLVSLTSRRQPQLSLELVHFAQHRLQFLRHHQIARGPAVLGSVGVLCDASRAGRDAARRCTQ